MMLLRIRAIYCNNLLITVILSIILTVETGINVWLIYHESRKLLPFQKVLMLKTYSFRSGNPQSLVGCPR